MKVYVTGQIEFIKDGIISIPIIIDSGKNTRIVKINYEIENLTTANWNEFLNSSKPFFIKDFSNYSDSKWIFKGKLVLVENRTYESEDEVKLEVMNAVFRHEKKYNSLRRQVEAFNNLEKINSAQREQIPDSVRLFVWQRDGGKCVKCGANEKLEFDHIIPVAKGGSNTERNIQLLCERCNRQKGAKIY